MDCELEKARSGKLEVGRWKWEVGTVSKGQRAIGQGLLIMNTRKGFQFPTVYWGQGSAMATNDFASIGIYSDVKKTLVGTVGNWQLGKGH